MLFLLFGVLLRFFYYIISLAERKVKWYVNKKNPKQQKLYLKKFAITNFVTSTTHFSLPDDNIYHLIFLILVAT